MFKKALFLILVVFSMITSNVYAASCNGSPVYAKDKKGICCLKKYLQENGSCDVNDVSLDSSSKKLYCENNEGKTTYYYPTITYTSYVANEYFNNDKSVIIYDDECTFYQSEKIDITYPKQNLVEAGRGVVLTVNVIETKSYYPSSNRCSDKLIKYMKKVKSDLNPKLKITADSSNFQITNSSELSYLEISSNTDYIIEGAYEIITKKVYDVPGYVVSGTGQVIKDNSSSAMHRLYTKFTLNTKIYNLDLVISNFSSLAKNRALYLDCDYRILSKYFMTSDEGIVDKNKVNYYSRNVSLTNLFPKYSPAVNWASYSSLIDKIQQIGNEIYRQEPLYKAELTASNIKSIRDYNKRYSYTEFRGEFTRQYYNKK